MFPAGVGDGGFCTIPVERRVIRELELSRVNGRTLKAKKRANFCFAGAQNTLGSCHRLLTMMRMDE